MEREFSAGGVVLRRMRGQWFVAAIAPAGKPGILALPKGMIDPGESPDQTSVREAFEETGVQSEVVAKLGDVKYTYVRTFKDNARVFKVVSFYLLRYRGGRIGEITPAMRKEVAGAHWVPLEDAPKRLAYGGERDMARAALAFVTENGGGASEHSAEPATTE